MRHLDTGSCIWQGIERSNAIIERDRGDYPREVKPFWRWSHIVTCYFALIVSLPKSISHPSISLLGLVVLLLLSVRGALSHRPRHGRPPSKLLNPLLGLRSCVPHPRKPTTCDVLYFPDEPFRARFAAAGSGGGVAGGEEGGERGRGGWW